MKEKWLKIGRILLRVLTFLSSIGLFVTLWFVLVIANPQETEKDDPGRQNPIVSPSASGSISLESDLYRLMLSFPAPVMSFLSGSGMHFVSGTCEDTPMDGGYARTIHLSWTSPEGWPVELYSIYPAHAVSVMGKQDYTFSAISGPSLAGTPSVRMENKQTIRLHTQTDQGLYYVVFPKEAASLLSASVRSLQLFSVQP